MGWNAKIGSEEIAGVTGKFGPGIENEAGQSQQFCQENMFGHRKYPLRTT